MLTDVLMFNLISLSESEHL